MDKTMENLIDKYFAEKYPKSQRVPYEQRLAEKKAQIAINDANRRFRKEDEGYKVIWCYDTGPNHGSKWI